MRKVRYFAAFAIALVALLLVTSIVLGVTWKYKTAITVDNELTSSRTGLIAIVDEIKGDNLISAGFVNSYATDTNMQEATTSRKFLICDNKTLLFIPSISASQEKNFDLYMGYSPTLSSFPFISGEGGYVTIADASALELGTNFDVNLNGWIDVSNDAGPIIEDIEESTMDTQVTSHAVTLPENIDDGDLLILHTSVYDSDAATPDITWPAGWTQIIEDSPGSSTTTRAGTCYKYADGTEGSSVNYSTGSDTAYSASQVYLLSNCEGAPVSSGSTMSTGSSVNPNSPSATIAGNFYTSPNSLWISCFASGGATSYTVTTLPTDYSDDHLTVSAAGSAKVCSSSRTIATETATENPSAWTVSASIAWGAWTIGVEGCSTPLVSKEGSYYLYGYSNDLYFKLHSPSYYYYNQGTYESDWTTGSTVGNGTQSKETDHLRLLTNSSAGERTYVLSDSVDLTNIDTLYIDWSNNGSASSNNCAFLCVHTSQMSNYASYNYRLQHQNAFSRTIESLDVSAASGSYYIRVHSYCNAASITSEVNAFNIYGVDASGKVVLIVSDLVSNDYDISSWSNGTTLGIDVDDVTENSTSFSHYGSIDNSNNIVLSNVPYFDYYKHTISGTLVAWYQPLAMIDSTVLPDREGTAQNGVITWGISSSGLTITIGETTIFTDTTHEYTEPSEGGTSIVPVLTEPENWYPDCTEANMPFYTDNSEFHGIYTMYKDAADNLGMSVCILFLMTAVAVSVAAGFGVMIFTGSTLLTTIITGLAMAACVSMTIIGWWMIFVYIVISVGTLYLARTT